MLTRYCEICGSKVEDRLPEDETLCASCLRAIGKSVTQVVTLEEAKDLDKAGVEAKKSVASFFDPITKIDPSAMKKIIR